MRMCPDLDQTSSRHRWVGTTPDLRRREASRYPIAGGIELDSATDTLTAERESGREALPMQSLNAL
jgi:hypothetical protein